MFQILPPFVPCGIDGGKAFESVVISLTRSLIPVMVGIPRGAEMKREKTPGEHIYIKMVRKKDGIHLRKRMCHTSTHHEIQSKQSNDRCPQDHVMTVLYAARVKVLS
jgi:hypothetical protein